MLTLSPAVPVVTFTPAQIADVPCLGGHTNTERGYLPILASKLSWTLAEFANEIHSPPSAVPPIPHGPPGSATPSVTLAQQEQQALRNIQVFVSEADRHPLERI